MAGKHRKPSPFSIYIAVLEVLQVFAIALFIYGSATNGLPQPVLPGKRPFALGMIMLYG